MIHDQLRYELIKASPLLWLKVGSLLWGPSGVIETLTLISFYIILIQAPVVSQQEVSFLILILTSEKRLETFLILDK